MPNLLTESEAAALLGVAPITLQNWRKNGVEGLAHIKLGPRQVRYLESDIVRFIEKCRRAK